MWCVGRGQGDLTAVLSGDIVIGLMDDPDPAGTAATIDAGFARHADRGSRTHQSLVAATPKCPSANVRAPRRAGIDGTASTRSHRIVLRFGSEGGGPLSQTLRPCRGVSSWHPTRQDHGRSVMTGLGGGAARPPDSPHPALSRAVDPTRNPPGRGYRRPPPRVQSRGSELSFPRRGNSR